MVVSRVFGKPCSTIQCILRRVIEYVVAIRHKVSSHQHPGIPSGCILRVCRARETQLTRKQRESSTAAMFESSYQLVLMVSATGNRKVPPSIILKAVCDHRGSFIDTWAGLGQSTMQESSARAHFAGIHSTLLQGSLAMQAEGITATHSTSTPGY